MAKMVKLNTDYLQKWIEYSLISIDQNILSLAVQIWSNFGIFIKKREKIV